MESIKIDMQMCPFDIALDTIAGKWKFAILYSLTNNGTLRFKELERSIPTISTRMLVKELKDLEVKKILKREAFATVPPTVQYSLTELGISLIPVINSLSAWGEYYLKEVEGRLP